LERNGWLLCTSLEYYCIEDISGEPLESWLISYLDVDQGDSILITTPEGSHILVDGGGTLNFGEKEAWRIRRSPFEVGAKVLVPLLKKRGIHRLDAIILTHGDQDHAGGLQAVLEGIPVSALLFNGTIADREPYKKLISTALKANVRLYGAQGCPLLPILLRSCLFYGRSLQAPNPNHNSLNSIVEDQNR
jgi:competence protein ComEC